MSRIKRGWALTKKSWALLRQHPELIRFPLYGAVATVPLAIVTIGPGLYLFEEDQLAGAIPLLVIGVYVLSVVGFYFSVGLAAAADMIFRGQANVAVADGLAVARSRFSQICGWAAVSTAIGVAMGVLENQGGIGGHDRRPPGRHGLGAGHLPRRAGDRARGHGPARDAEALGLDLPRALGAADHRQHRDRRRRRPARHPPRDADDRRRGHGLVLGSVHRRAARHRRRDRAGGRAADLEGAERHLRRRPLPLRDRGAGRRRLHPEELESAVKAKKGGRNAPPTATPGTV